MANYAITFGRAARKELESLSDPLINRIFTQIESLGEMPRPTGCRKLQGSSDLWRIRVGDYRIVYSINDELRLVDVIAVRHRSKAYD